MLTSSTRRYTRSAALCADSTLAAWGNNHGTPLPVTLIIKVTARDGLASTTYRLGIVNVVPLFSGYEAATPHQTATALHLRKLLAPI